MKKLIITTLLILTQLSAITYEYDELNRLETATYENGVVYTYSYDDAGNLQSITSKGVKEIDTDGDGISDTREAELGLRPDKKDSDDDGYNDLEEVGDVNNPRDTDGDGIIDARDDDSDGDGVSDADERVAGTDPTDKNEKPIYPKVSLAPIDDIVMPKNGPRKPIDLVIVNTTDEVTNISTTSYNTDLVVTSDTDPMYIEPVHGAKGHTTVKVRVSAGGKSDTKTFTAYVGEKPKKFVPIMIDDITIMVPLD